MGKTLIVGWDGASIDLLMRWTREGCLPTVQGLMTEGAWGTLESTIPFHSPAAWSTFMTGTNPGSHGIYDFVRLERSDYGIRLVRHNDIRGARWWDYLRMLGKHVGLVNVPMTYPPPAVNGFAISGLGTPEGAHFAYPSNLEPSLRSRNYRVNRTVAYKPGREALFLADVVDVTERQTDTVLALMREAPWDVLAVVYRGSDDLAHFFWRHLDATHPRHDPSAPEWLRHAVREFYGLLDRHLAKLLRAAGPDTDVLLISDHGAGPLYKDVYLNEWFRGCGWLALDSNPTGKEKWYRGLRRIGLTRARASAVLHGLGLHRAERSLKALLGDRIGLLPRDHRPEVATSIDWNKTRVFTFGYFGQIYLNVRGKLAAGTVEPGPEYERLREEVSQSIRGLVDPDDGRAIVERVYRKEELFRGDAIDGAPDLIAMMSDGVYMARRGHEFARAAGRLVGIPETDESGSHRLDGILVAAGPRVAPLGELPPQRLVDVAPTILRLHGQTETPTMEGTPMPFVTGAPTVDLVTSKPYEAGQTEIVYGADEEADVLARLRDLGYVE